MTLSRRVVWLLLAVPLVVYIVPFAASLVNEVRLSFTTTPTFSDPGEDLTTAQYELALFDPSVLTSWRVTLELSLLAAVLATLVGAAVAYTLWRVGGRVRTVMTMVVIAPMLVSAVVRAYGWLATTGREGLLWKTTSLLGLPPVEIMFNRTAVVIGLVHVLLPYAMLMILTSLDGIRPSVLRAAANLGAGPLTTFGRVVLPLIRTGVLSSLLITFSLAAASYSIPVILGGGRLYPIARAVFQESTSTLNFPLAAALAVLLLLLCLTAAVVAQRLTRSRRERVEKLAMGPV